MLLGARTSGRLYSAASLQWLEARATDPAPPTGTAYDAYTHGVGATAELGYRVPPSVGRLARRPRPSPPRAAATASRATAIRADASFSQAAHQARWSLRTHRRVAVVGGAGGPARRLDRLDHPARERADRRGLAARPHRVDARRRQRGHAAGAGGSLLPRRRRRPAQSRSPTRAGPLGGGSGPSSRARRRLDGRHPRLRRPGGAT